MLYSTAKRSPRRPAQTLASRPQEPAIRQRGDRRPIDINPGRSMLILIFIMVASLALTARLTFWSVLAEGRLVAEMDQQSGLGITPPLRGEILDAGGQPLATDITMNVVYAVPSQILHPQRTADLLAPVLGTKPKYIMQRIVNRDAGYVKLSNPIDKNVTQKVRDLALPGIVLTPEIHRAYPDGTLAAQTLGYDNIDDVGNYGLEGYYDRLLSGQAGLQSVLRDTAGNNIHIGTQASTPARGGGDLHLSLDSVVQGIAETELQKAVAQHQADSGTCIVMDPHTGYILAMASTPSYNPNQYYNVTDSDLFKNPAIQWTYEPGSTFKIITMAAGLDAGVITPQSSFYDNGTYTVAGTVIHNWNLSGFGEENMIQVLQHSANVGASWVANRLGTASFYKYVRGFRFGQPTGVDLSGEEPGILPLPGDKTWTIVNLYTNSFGQGLAVTPLQMIRAVAAVANGGIMMKPQLVKQIIYDGRVIDHRPVREGRVISAQTAHTLTNMLVQSAVDGEAQLSLVKGYNIAAKTGTANVAGPDGKYIPGDTVASIVGYAPAQDPRFVALVIINHPRDTIWGSVAAAPVLHNLFQDLFMYYHIPPSPNAVYR